MLSCHVLCIIHHVLIAIHFLLTSLYVLLMSSCLTEFPLFITNIPTYIQYPHFITNLITLSLYYLTTLLSCLQQSMFLFCTIFGHFKTYTLSYSISPLYKLIHLCYHLDSYCYRYSYCTSRSS